MRISAAARFGGVVDNEADCLCALRVKSASQVRRHAEAVYLWRRVRMGSVGRTRQLSSCLTSLCPSHVSDSCPHMARAAASSRFYRPVRCGLDCRFPLALRMRDAARSFWFGADGASNIPSLPRSMRRFA